MAVGTAPTAQAGHKLLPETDELADRQADELDALIHAVKTTKRTVKGLMGQMRVTTQFLADVDERLMAYRARLERTAKEAQTDGNRREEAED